MTARRWSTSGMFGDRGALTSLKVIKVPVNKITSVPLGLHRINNDLLCWIKNQQEITQIFYQPAVLWPYSMGTWIAWHSSSVFGVFGNFIKINNGLARQGNFCLL